MSKVITFELVIFVCVLCILFRLRKNSILSIRILEGLIVYMPPQPEDLKMLEETSDSAKKKVKTNMKGEARDKRDKTKLNRKQSIPLRTVTIDQSFLKYNMEYFESYDLILTLFIASLLSFVITTFVRTLPYPEIQNMVKGNLAFYLMLFIQLMVI